MPKLTIENFFRAIITSNTPIPATGDFQFDLSVAPIATNGFLVIGGENITTRQIVYFHNRIGNTIYVRGENRYGPVAISNPEKLSVKMNDVAEIFNFMNNNMSPCFYVEKTGGLNVKVWGGYVEYNRNQITVADTTLTLADNTTNYIKYDPPTNVIGYNGSDTGHVKAVVTTSSGVITNIEYRVTKESYIDATIELTGALPDQTGHNGEALITSGGIVQWSNKFLTSVDFKKGFNTSMTSKLLYGSPWTKIGTFIGLAERSLITIFGGNGFGSNSDHVGSKAEISLYIGNGSSPDINMNGTWKSDLGDACPISIVRVSKVSDNEWDVWVYHSGTYINNSIVEVKTSGTFVPSFTGGSAPNVGVGIYDITKYTPTVNIASLTEKNTYSKNDKKIIYDSISGTNKAQKAEVQNIGGDGSDGALNISSGTTTLTLSGNYIEKNYSSINISGTAILQVTGATGNGGIAYIKCAGDFTMSAGQIKMDGQGGQGAPTNSSSGAGTAGTGGIDSLMTQQSNFGAAGTYGSGGNTSASVGGGLLPIPMPVSRLFGRLHAFAGAGGGSGANYINTYNPTGGAGGAGGGIIIIEVGGKINFTGGTISSAGTNGSNGGNGNAGYTSGGGGGGGGGGGSVIILYNELVASSGTVNVNGGNGGNGGTIGTGNNGGGGGGGGLSSGGNGGGVTSYVGQAGAAGTNNSFGNGGSAGTAGAAGGGGGGGAGFKVIKQISSY